MTQTAAILQSPSLIGSHRRRGAITWSRFSAMLIGADILALALAVLAATHLTIAFEQGVLHMPAFTDQGWVVTLRRHIFGILCLCQIAMFWNKGLYTERLPWWSQVQYIGRVAFFLFVLDGFISFGLKLSEPRMLIASDWLFAFVATVSLRWFAAHIAVRHGLASIPTVVIGEKAMAADIVSAFDADPCAGYKAHTLFIRDRDTTPFDVSELPASSRRVTVRDGLQDYAAYIKEHPNYFYAISLSAFRDETRAELIKVLDNVHANYAIVPSINGVGVYEMQPRYFFGHDIMMLQPRSRSALAGMSLSKVLKRSLDIAVAGTALLMLSPVFAIVSALLKIEGQGGTLFYGGKRIGKNGKYFSCWKFRSMEPDSDHLLHAYLDSDPEAKANWEKYRKLPRDPRVTTKTAAIIRKASIDELPQLWNVLVGDMSLVGPRPILDDEKKFFGDAIKDYLSVRPGLTGLWQVSGRNATSFVRRVYWDRWYVRNWSLWGDIVILIKTPFVLISRKGAS